jgi:hypothetical protein
MANTILLKRASTAGKVPVLANLSLGELSINSTDGRLYTTTGSAIVDLTQNDKITLSGDATGTSTNPAAGGNYSNLAVTLSSTGVTAGNYGSATSIPTIVVDAKGRVTSLTTNAVSTTISLAGTTGSGSVAGGGTLTVNGLGAITTSISGSTITIAANGSVTTANVSLYDSVTALTTNQIFYPQFSNLSVTGNSITGVATSLAFNPGAGSGTLNTGTLLASTVNAGTIGNAGATLTGTLSTAAQTNITSVGTLTSLAVGAVTSSGTVIASTVNAGTIGNAGASHIGASATLTGTVIASTVQAGTIGNAGATLTGTLSTAAQTNITSVGTLTSLAVGAVTSSGAIIASSVNAGTIGNAGATLTGTLSTAAQTNITSVGTLTSLTTSGDVTVGGNLTIQGNTVTIGSNNLTVTDSIIDLHTFANLAPLTSDDGRDVGIRFHYYKGTDKHAFLGWENSLETLIYYANVSEAGSNVTGTLGNVQFGSLTLSNTAATVLTVGGNTAINSSLYAQSLYDSSNRVVSTSSGAGNLTISGGAISLTATGPGAVTVGSVTHHAIITTDAYGRVVTLANTAISLPFGSLTATPTTLTGYGITDALSTSATIDGGTY